MGIDDLTQKLVHNRLLQNEEQLKEYEQTIETIIAMNSSDCIRVLCLGFDDETENDEVMFGLLHTIEALDKELGLEQSLTKQAEAFQYMLPHAKEWAVIFHKRILNQDVTRKAYAEVILNADNNTKDIVVSILNEIGIKNQVKFGVTIEEFMTYIKKLEKM